MLHITSSVMLCSGIKVNAQGHSTTDTDESHFSFAVYSIDPVRFADALQKCIDNRASHQSYWTQDWIELKSSLPHDTIRFQRDNATLSITRGNLKVLYIGCIDVLHGLPDAIYKEYKKYESKLEK